MFESLVLKWANIYVKPQINDKQYGGMAGTCTTDALVEMLHKWYESTDVIGHFGRVLFLDYSKAFVLINHDILLNKVVGMEVPPHLVRRMAAFLLDREQRVKPKYLLDNIEIIKKGVSKVYVQVSHTKISCIW